MRWRASQFRESAVTRESRGIAHELAEPPVIRMLVLHEAWREDESRTNPANDRGEFDGVRGADLEMRITVELEELDRDAENFRCLLRFNDALLRSAVRASLAMRTHDEVHCAASACLACDHAAAAELDVVGMSAESEDRGSGGRFSRGFPCRLHQSGRSRHVSQS